MGYSSREQCGWCWILAKGFRWMIGLYVVLEILSLALSLSFVYWSKHAVDIATKTVQGELRLTVVYIIGSVALALLIGQLASWLNERVKIRMLICLQNSLVFSQMRVPWEETKRWHTGDLLVRINSDCKEVVQMLGDTLPSLGVTCVRLLASWGFLFMMDPLLAGMILAITPLFLFSKLYYRKMRRLSREAKEAESRLGTILQENLKLRLLIRALNITDVRRTTYQNGQNDVYTLRNKQLQFSILTQTLLKYTFNGGYLVAFLWGVYRLHVGQISFGTLTAFLQLVGRVQPPILSIISFVPAAIRCRAAVDRLMELFEGEREEENGTLHIKPPRSLKLNNVCFRYEDRKVIDHLNAEMLPGRPTAIVGTTGKGKTTLIRLLLALVHPEEGTLKIEADGRWYSLTSSMRANFSYVPQGNTLFCGTIRENLLMTAPTASEDQLRGVLQLACADFVFTFPQGLETKVGESGYGLSEGQAQRIAVARALLRDSKIWLFDEATSALDTTTSRQLINNLLEAGRDKIIVFVTHDPHLMEACAQIIRLEE